MEILILAIIIGMVIVFFEEVLNAMGIHIGDLILEILEFGILAIVYLFIAYVAFNLFIGLIELSKDRAKRKNLSEIEAYRQAKGRKDK